MTISEGTLRYLRSTYTHGRRVRLVHMDDPYTKLCPGELGRVLHVDSTGTVHIDWDCGSQLGAVYGIDSIELADEED